MKSFVRKLTPESALRLYRKLKRSAERRENTRKSTEEVFTEIYARNSWGGEDGDYFSGGGTADERIASEYVSCLESLKDRLDSGELRAVDLGCGDMRIGRRICDLFGSYTGVDIVRELVAKHNAEFGNERRRFVHLNMIEDELPDGEVCLIRQVLQHLSNAQIQQVLRKVRKYRYVVITEHLPAPNPGLRRNLDKPHGGDIRIYDNSGVYLCEVPFNLPQEQCEVLLEVEGHGYENYSEPWMTGVIQTMLYQPQPPGEPSPEANP